MGFFPAALRKLLPGGFNPFGEVFPPKPNPPPLSVDGRTAGLRVLREYVTALTFFRSAGRTAPPIAFQIKRENFHIEWPDNVVDMVTPSIVVIAAPQANYVTVGLVSTLEEGTRDLFQRGTVLQVQDEYTEVINLEIWASSKAERRAIIAGLEVALTPTEQMSGLRFTMPEYFDELVCFSLQRRRIIDDADGARNRRRAQLEVEMRHNVVALVNYLELQPTVVVETDVEMNTQTPVVIDPDTDPNAVLLDQNTPAVDPNADPNTGSG